MNPETTNDLDDDLRPEYDLSQLLKGGVRGKYVDRCNKAGTNLVLLDLGVAEAFPTSEKVNEALLLLMQAAKIPLRL